MKNKQQFPDVGETRRNHRSLAGLFVIGGSWTEVPKGASEAVFGMANALPYGQRSRYASSSPTASTLDP